MESLVLELIKQHIAVYVDLQDRLKLLNQKPVAMERKSALDDTLAGIQARKGKVANFIKNLYEDFADGVFSEEEYLEMKAGYVAELETLDTEAEAVKADHDSYGSAYGSIEMSDAFSKYIGVNELSRELITTFIKKITCYGNDRFEVEYTFADELAGLQNLVEKRGCEVA